MLGCDLVGNTVFPPLVPSVVVLEKIQRNDTVVAYEQGNVFHACAVTGSIFQLAQQEEGVCRYFQVEERVGSSATQPSDAPDMILAGEKEDSDSSCVEGVLVDPEASRNHIVGELTGAELGRNVMHHDQLACVGPDELRSAQQEDKSLQKLFGQVGKVRKLEGGQELLEVQNHILYRRWTPCCKGELLYTQECSQDIVLVSCGSHLHNFRLQQHLYR
ncbi:hypothetical protein Pcinc_019397 [Petrolisthes cinctipes]|uniref:Uncharacterized protein n=1 Tax=Petrolisthes cinctipes TaxID=88211 RepID=A0AAE1FK79_PETCI|nr:hypothetical protein Pcinc_019397 [Petrolisthes cinctipes]